MCFDRNQAKSRRQLKKFYILISTNLSLIRVSSSNPEDTPATSRFTAVYDNCAHAEFILKRPIISVIETDSPGGP